MSQASELPGSDDVYVAWIQADETLLDGVRNIDDVTQNAVDLFVLASKSHEEKISFLKKWTALGGNIDAEHKTSFEMPFDGTESTTLLMYALHSMDNINRFGEQLLEAGADPKLTTHVNSDPTKEALELKNPRLLELILSRHPTALKEQSINPWTTLTLSSGRGGHSSNIGDVFAILDREGISPFIGISQPVETAISQRDPIVLEAVIDRCIVGAYEGCTKELVERILEAGKRFLDNGKDRPHSPSEEVCRSLIESFLLTQGRRPAPDRISRPI